MEVSQGSTPSAHDGVIEKIRDMLLDGEYGPGSRLPSERALSERFGVSRPTVREAMRTLMNLGILETRHGSGTTVSVSRDRLLRASFEFMVILDRPTLLELYETREVLEVHLAGKAAKNRTDADLARMQNAIDRMASSLDDTEGWTEANVEFHEAIASAAHQPILERIMVGLYGGIKACIESTAPMVVDLGRMVELHRAIFEGIRQQNVSAAKKAMRQHMAVAIEELSRITSKNT
jgi:GntR family transcriptional regulator, transcriptional repressor for pyruvate dehydrogenase complex